MVRLPLKFVFMAAGMALMLVAMRGVMPAVWRVGWETMDQEAFLGVAWCYQLAVASAIAVWMSCTQSRADQMIAVYGAGGIAGLTLLEMAVPIAWVPLQATALMLSLGLIGVLVGLGQWRVFWLGLAELHAVLVVVAAWQRIDGP